MKKIIFQTREPQTILIDEIGCHLSIGFTVNDGNGTDKGWLQAVGIYNENRYKPLSTNSGVNHANGYDEPLKLHDLLSKLNKSGKFTFYVFNNNKELFAWLSKD